MKELIIFKRRVAAIATLLLLLASPSFAEVYTSYTATDGTAGETDEYNFAKLLDGDKTSEWSISEYGSPTFIEFYSEEAIVPNGYVMTTGHYAYAYPNYSPKGWVVKAKANASDTEWVTLATVSQDTKLLRAGNYDSYYYFENTTAYQYFRLELTQKDGSSRMQLSEFQFLTDIDHGDLRLGTISEIVPSGYFPITGSSREIDYTVTDCLGNELTEGTHYTTTLTLNGSPADEVKDEGKYVLTATAIDGSGYSGELTTSFEVTNKVEIGTNSSNIYYDTKFPIYTKWNYSLSEQIYTAAEIGERNVGSSFTGIDFYCLGAITRNIEIYMVHTDKQSISHDERITPTASDLVFSGDVTFNEGGWTPITFDTPFKYTGGNIAIMVYDKTNEATNGYINFLIYTPSTSNQSISFYSHSAMQFANLNTASSAGSSQKSLIRLTMGDMSDYPRPTELIADLTYNSATFNWTENGTTINWRLELSTDKDFNNIIWIEDATLNPTITLNDLTEEATYYARIKSLYVNPQGESQWSYISFTIPEHFAKPTDLKKDSFTSTSATLSWTENGTAASWVLEYATDASFTTGVESVEANLNPSVVIDGLDEETTYYARVKAVYGDDDESGWSLPLTFMLSNMAIITSTTTENLYYLPIHTYYNYSISQQIYTKEEIGAENANQFVETIDLMMKSTEISSGKVTRNIDVYMTNARIEGTPGSQWIAPATTDLVFSGNVTFESGKWTTIPLQNLFKYDGDMMVLTIDDNTGSYEEDSYFASFVPEGNELASYSYDDDNDYDPFDANDYLDRVQKKNAIRLTFGNVPRPSRLALTNKNENSATLNWTENGTATKWVFEYTTDATFKTGVESMEVTDEPSINITGLDGEATYYARVKAVYGEDDESNWSSILAFNIADKWLVCAGEESSSPYLPTYTYYDNSISQQVYTAAEIGEDRANTYFSSIDFMATSTNETNGEFTRSLDIYMTNYDDIYSSPINVNEDDLVFSGEVTFKAGEWTSIPLDTPFKYEGDNMVLTVNDLTGEYTWDECYFATYETSDSSYYAYDNNSFDPLSLVQYNCSYLNCKTQIRLASTTSIKPTNLEVIEMTGEFFTVTWTENNDVSEWIVEVSPDDQFGTDVETFTVNDNPRTSIWDLTSERTYYLRIKSVLGDDDYSDWSKTIAIDFTAKVNVGYDGTTSTSLPVNIGSVYSISEQIYTAEEIDYSNAGRLIEAIDYMIHDGNPVVVRDIDIFMVNTDKETLDSKTDWVPVGEENLVFSGKVSFKTSGWQSINLDIPFEYDGSNLLVCVYEKDGDSSDYIRFTTFISDFTIRRTLHFSSSGEIDPVEGDYEFTSSIDRNQIRLLFNKHGLISPSRLTLSDLTGTTATFDWQENGNSTNWVFEYSTDSRFVNDVQAKEIETNPTVTLTGLTPDTQYFSRVKAVDGYASSNWTAVCNFMPTYKVILGSEMASSSDLPFDNFYNYSLTQQIYTADEIGVENSGKNIESIDFKCLDSSPTRDLEIYMVNTDQGYFEESDSWNAIAVTSDDLVFDGEVTFTAGQWTSIILDTPFAYTGSNLAVIVNDKTGSYFNSANFYTYKCDGIQALLVYQDNNGYNPSNVDGMEWDYKDSKNHILLGFDNSLIIDDSADNNDAIIAANNKTYNVTLNRHIKQGVNTMVLPFEFTADEAVAYFGDDAKVYVVAGLKSINGNSSISLERCTDAVEPNRPFLLISGEEVDMVDFGSRTIMTTSPEGSLPVDATEGIAFTGTYDNLGIGAGNNYYVVSNSKLYYVTTDVDVRPTRAFFQLTAGSGDVKEISLAFNDDESTDIIDIASCINTSQGIYDLSGRKVSKPAKGMYIINGKKVMIK